MLTILSSLPVNNKMPAFNNEWLWLGNLGHSFVVISFIATLLFSYFYFQDARSENITLKKWARNFLYLHSFSVVAVFSILFAIIFFHRYEFFYAWRHSSNALPVYYMISCFWEGQEGSFLLWIFWNSIIALILRRSAGKWESPVIAIIGLGQIALGSMLLGFHWGDLKIGSSPFDLLRDVRPEFLNIPILGSIGVENYLQVFKDGNGLNKLLQNYWMVIHPPTLFLGFALAIVPFAYSVAALWKRDQRSWIHPAIIWSIACVGILGAGIIMGGFWAYESLSFGGYWAWDPVENASLLPWLIMTSALHMLLISKNTGRHLFTSHLLTQISFWLVLYATFLTRSGILGEASVHSFTDLGLSGQLLLFLFGFIGLSTAVSFVNTDKRLKFTIAILAFFAVVVIASYSIPASWKDNYTTAIKYIGIGLFVAVLGLYLRNLYKSQKTELADEHLLSREFWIFLGSLFIILSLVQVFSATSIPVFNKLFGLKNAVPQAQDYNNIQLWMAMPIMLLMSVGQYFRYKETQWSDLLRDLKWPAIICIISFGVLTWGFEIEEFPFILFLFFGVLLSGLNFAFLFRKRKNQVLRWGASISHFGFGVLLIGVLVSSVKKNVLTTSQEGINLAPEQDQSGKIDEKGIQFNRENKILYQGEPVDLIGYKAVYLGSKKGIHYDSLDEFFTVSFVSKTNPKDSFKLVPKTQNNPQMGLLAEPSTKHYLHKDVFTHVNYQSGMDKTEPYSSFKLDTLYVGQKGTSSSGKCQYIVKAIEKASRENGLALRLEVEVERLNEKEIIHPEILINEQTGSLESLPVQLDKLGFFMTINSFDIQDPDPSKQKIAFVVQTGEKTPVKNYIVVKIIEFPWINLVWFGTIIMVIGFAFAIIDRILAQKRVMA